MRKTEVVYIVAVLIGAFVFSAFTVFHARTLLAPDVAITQRPGGVAGEARDIDVGRFRELIRQHDLSDHEAAYSAPILAPE